MMTFDIVLVYAWSRVHNHYLPLIRHLSSELSIAVIQSKTPKVMKNPETEQSFLDLCFELGARDPGDEPLSCGLLVVPQFRYSEGYLDHLFERVQARSVCAVQIFGAGVQNLEPIGLDRLDCFYVYDRRVLMEHKLEDDAQRKLAGELDIREMGSPFARYPVFPEFSTDYIIAFPTDLSFVDTRSKALFARNVDRILGRIPPDDDIVIKLHNVKDGGYLLERDLKYFNWGYKSWPITRWAPILDLPGKYGEALSQLTLGSGYGRILDRATSMEHRSAHHNLGIELFLPGTRKGVISGRSTVSWHALANRIPYYNCDDETRIAKNHSVLVNHEAFGIPPCHGKLEFDDAHFGRIAESTRSADLLEQLKGHL